jgi:hypothetical protein
MAVDLATGTQLFEIGSRGGIDDWHETIYCLRHNNQYIPFSVREKAEVGWKPLAEFNMSSYRYLHPDSGIRVVDAEVRHIGVSPHSVKMGVRSHVWFMDVWDGIHTDIVFATETDRASVFRNIQEALPVLCFDAYKGYVTPEPRICGTVGAVGQEWQLAADTSGSIEGASVMLKAPSSEPLTPNEVLDSLEARMKISALPIEEILADVLDVERGTLFFGNLFAETLVNDLRFWDLLRISYSAHYAGYYDRFDRFLLRIVGLIKARLDSRLVHERYSRFREA